MSIGTDDALVPVRHQGISCANDDKNPWRHIASPGPNGLKTHWGQVDYNEFQSILCLKSICSTELLWIEIVCCLTKLMTLRLHLQLMPWRRFIARAFPAAMMTKASFEIFLLFKVAEDLWKQGNIDSANVTAPVRRQGISCGNIDESQWGHMATPNHNFNQSCWPNISRMSCGAHLFVLYPMEEYKGVWVRPEPYYSWLALKYFQAHQRSNNSIFSSVSHCLKTFILTSPPDITHIFQMQLFKSDNLLMNEIVRQIPAFYTFDSRWIEANRDDSR